MLLINQYLKNVRQIAFMAIIFLFLSIILNSYFSSTSYNELLYKRFQIRFVSEQNELDLRLDNLSDLLQTEPLNSVMAKKVKEFRDLAKNRDIYFFVYRNDSMMLWSDNRIIEAEILPAIAQDNKLLQLTNGWFYNQTRTVGNYRIIGLLLIKNNYSIQNNYLANTFNPIFSFPNEVIIKSNVKNDYVIYTNDKKPAFSLLFNSNPKLTKWQLTILVLLFSISFALILLLYRRLVCQQKTIGIKLIFLLGGGLILVLLKLLMSILKFPDFLYKISLFQPAHFSLPNILPSLGDLFIFSIIFYIIFYCVYTEFNFNITLIVKNLYIKTIIRVFVIVLVLIYFLFANNLFEKIIFNSSNGFNLHEFFNVGYLPVFGLLSFTFLFGIFIFFVDYSVKSFFANVSQKYAWTIFAVTTIVCLILYYIISHNFDWVTFFLLISTLFLIIKVKQKNKGKFHYGQIIFLVFVFSLYSVYIIYHINNTKSISEKKILAATLSLEHDPVAEYLMTDLNVSLLEDSIIKTRVLKEKIDYPWIIKYIRKKYFNGYWERYEMQITFCKPTDSVLLKPDLKYLPCFSFFNNLIEHNAQKIGETGYYFLKNLNGHISYITSLNYRDSINGKLSSLFLQIDSRLAANDLGFPDLLLDEKFTLNQNKLGYSYAKYYQNKLVYQTGNFNYNLGSEKYPNNNSKYSFSNFNGYNHVLYRPDHDNLLILSKPEIGMFDILVSFSYIFIFYFIILNLMLIVASQDWVKFQLKNDFKTKIRLSVVGVLFLSLISVGSLTIYFMMKQYQSKHYEIVKEKLQSVLLELESELSNETILEYNWNSFEYNNLEELLRRLSNVFYTDINLYDKNGRMIASSRPEIFDKGLSGTFMNQMAYFEIAHNNKAELVQEESIGGLNYLSIYTPFANYQNHFLAYINLPYFTRQSAISGEISSMLLAIINFYVLLILVSLGLAVFISQKITQPLRIIQDKFSSIKLGTRSEKIVYKNQDEIGDLVEEYNRMVDELEHSVKLLAKSERELAWREMAKQVAHEIKNPLTPMKLSIQQLQRAWNDKSENLEDYFHRVTKTLVEQIDTLSTIATEFSNFAKMPHAKNEKIDIVELITDVTDLFCESGVDFRFQNALKGQYIVFADKEQISRVFINLSNNAIQAIPDDRKGVIFISYENVDNKVQISFKDNGSGIPEELTTKLFQPNFTTKSRGMGLGLAISKSIIENAGGQIKFKTVENKGTTFCILIPLVIQ